mgnify:CR=1 FL=1
MNNEKLSDGVSVVIPTYNSQALLDLTLQSLCAQEDSFRKFEVIVVDDGSADDTRSVVNRYIDTLDIRYYFQTDQGFRVSATRNAGIALAKYKVSLFLDAGMVAKRNLIRTHWNLHNKHSNVAVIGMSFGLEEFASVDSGVIENMLATYDSETAFKKLANYTALYDCRYDYLSEISFQVGSRSYPWVLFWTGHVSCPTKTLRQIHGFDENFTSWGGEDVELGIRLHNHGCKFVILEELMTINYPHPRSEPEKRKSSLENIHYIHELHRSKGTEMLFTKGWRDIISVTHPGSQSHTARQDEDVETV